MPCEPSQIASRAQTLTQACRTNPAWQVQIPDGVAPGGQMQVMTAQGAMMVQVPNDKKPGDMFTFMVPDAPVAPVATAVAAPMQPVMGTPAGPTVIIQQPVAPVMPVAPQMPTFFGRHPANITCPTHGTPSVTNISHEAGLGTWLACCGIAFVGCYLGCCFIPLCAGARTSAPRPRPPRRRPHRVPPVSQLHQRRQGRQAPLQQLRQVRRRAQAHLVSVAVALPQHVHVPRSRVLDGLVYSCRETLLSRRREYKPLI